MDREVGDRLPDDKDILTNSMEQEWQGEKRKKRGNGLCEEMFI